MNIWIDQGHGFGDPGACANGLREDQLSRELTALLVRLLVPHRDDLIITTTDNHFDSRPHLHDRPREAKRWGSRLFVSLHFNSGPPSAKGSEVWYGDSDSFWIAERYAGWLPVPRRGIKWGGGDLPETRQKEPSFEVLRAAARIGLPAVLLECCFVTNIGEASWLSEHGGLVDLAFHLSVATKFIVADMMAGGVSL